MSRARRGKNAVEAKAEELMRAPRAWIVRARYKALAFVAAIAVGAFATIAVVGAPWLPVVGVAVAALAVSVSNLTKGLGEPTCLSCGENLKDEPAGVHGVACPKCGAVNSGTLVRLAKIDRLRNKQDGGSKA